MPEPREPTEQELVDMDTFTEVLETAVNWDHIRRAIRDALWSRGAEGAMASELAPLVGCSPTMAYGVLMHLRQQGETVARPRRQGVDGYWGTPHALSHFVD